MTSAMRCRSSHSAVGPQASSTSYAAVAAASRPSKRAGVRRVASSRPAPRRACAHLGPQELLLLADAVLDTASGLAASGANEVAASGATEALASEALASGANEVAAAAPAATPSLGTFGGDTGSYWASLGLVILTAPGLWSLVKRSPKASVKSMTFQVPGPAQGGALDSVASTIATYFTKYNYKIVETGEVITFQGVYEANRGQGIALSFYVFLGLASISLVLSIINSEVGGWWYGLLLLTPLAYKYYMDNGTRTEEAKVKMVTTDDDKWTDVILQCDKEEIERFAKETGYIEKGKVKVKGLLEDTPLLGQVASQASQGGKGFGAEGQNTNTNAATKKESTKANVE